MRTTRRTLLRSLSTLAAGPFAASLGAQSTPPPGQPDPGIESRIKNRLKRKPPAPTPPPFVFFGSDTKRGGKGIYLSRFDPATGHLTSAALAAACINPAWIVLGQSAKRRLLYVANEGDQHTSGISAYTVDSTGALHLLGQVASGGAGPTYLSIDPSFQSLFVANYAGSSIASYRIQPDGTLSQPVERVSFRDPRFGSLGPDHNRQDAPHPHAAMIAPDNRFLLVTDLASDTIITFPVDIATARLGQPHLNQRRAGAGPRHLAFHPNGRWLYEVDELDNHVDQLLLNTTRGDTAHGFGPQALITDTSRSLPTTDPGFHGTNTAAEITISPSGRFLYISNRGEDSLVCFALDESTGAPTLVQRIACGGKTPRHFTLDPTGAWLLCANLDSNSVSVFSRNESTGHLTGPVQTVPVPAPQFILFV